MNDKHDLSTFTRQIKNQTYIFRDGKLVLKKIEKSVSFLKPIKKNMYNSKKFITMDLETRIIQGEMTSYCVSIFDGNNHKSFYLTDFNSEKEMLKNSITYLRRSRKRKYHNYKIYLHNFSKFEAVFMLSSITELSDKVNPIIRNGQFINLTMSFANKYELHFRDSLLILPGTLSSLAKNFSVDNKGLFPYKFVNNNNIDLNYIGEVPSYDNFESVKYQDYLSYKNLYSNNIWDLKKETIKYCELDCKVLYQIIDKFSDTIFELFRVDLLKYPTLSSLAFAIFRSKFLKGAKIPLILGEMYKFIKQSYTGGSVDVYRPTLAKDASVELENRVIKRYDVNSLYPYVMKHFPMPIGTPTYFEGDITKFEKMPFGIFEVEVECPSDINIPLLQVKIKTDSGYRTIAPTGTWTGKYFSDDLYNASKFGYKFKVKRFEKGEVFKDYVDTLYEIKQNSSKGSPNYIISKLLLNSLYGRLGMNPICEHHKILSNDDAINFYPKINVTNVVDLKNGKELISYYNDTSNSDDFKFDIKIVSVVISSVVTASARIYMSQFKTNNNIILYYTDTDSIDIEGDIDPKLIGEELGK
jgi:hypothetical protein